MRCKDKVYFLILRHFWCANCLYERISHNGNRQKGEFTNAFKPERVISDSEARAAIDEYNANFEKFDHAFFKMGEGSMYYGAGHYASNVEGTDRMYANIATENRQRSNTPMVEWRGQRVDYSDANFVGEEREN